PPFQIDGNFGCTSGIAEMLLQSHDGAIHLLPALPDAWPEGSVKGLVTRGGCVADVSGKDKEMESVKVTSRLGGNCRLRVYDELQGATSATHIKKAIGDNPNSFFEVPKIKEPLISPKAKQDMTDLKKTIEYDFPTKAGKVYVLKSISS